MIDNCGIIAQLEVMNDQMCPSKTWTVVEREYDPHSRGNNHIIIVQLFYFLKHFIMFVLKGANDKEVIAENCNQSHN
jgi:hypothetical protein